MLQEPWTHGFADLGEVRLHYVTAGSGPLLLLLHGFPENWHSWRHQIPVLARQFQVVAPDLRGFNDSDKPRGVLQYGLDKLTSDIQGLIRHFGHQKAVLVGHDWGGACAWAFASAHPEATTRLIVLNCPHPQAMQRQMFRNLRQLRRSWYMFFFQLPWIAERAILRDPMRFARRSFRGGAFNKQAFSAEDLRQYAEAIAKPGAATGGLNYYRAALLDLLGLRRFRFRPITIPTLLLWGEDDPALGRELTDGLQPYFDGDRLTLRFVQQCGHWIQQERPETVNRHILEFLADLRI